MIAGTTPIRSAVQSSPAFRGRLKPRLTKYIPNRPTKKQRAAMCLGHVREVFYGGAAGGGKSDWLLMEALQYVDIPDYHARIFRLTLADADNEGSIMFRANEWLAPFVQSREVKKEKGGTRFRFPSGASLSFGGLDKKDDHLKAQGAQFSYLGFDELTQFHKHQFEYLINSRLRKPGCSDHKNKRDTNCRYCQRYMHTDKFPLRVRTAANPGGRSHLYVKRRYDIDQVPGLLGPTGAQLYAGRFITPRPGPNGTIIPPRPHIPAFAHDNPFLDIEDYMQQMSQMSDPVTLAQLLAGDWGITADSRFRRAWAKRWRYDGRQIAVRDAKWYDVDDCWQFIMVDPASSEEDAPGRTELKKKESSWTVVSRWIVTPGHDLCLAHVDRFQDEMPMIIPAIKRQLAMSDAIRFVGMEYTTQSKHLYQDCRSKGLPMRKFETKGKDKIARSYDATTRMKDGKLLLPEEGPIWLQNYEDEVFTWTGAGEETDDQVDVTSYAAIFMTQEFQTIEAGMPGTWR